MKTLRKKPIIRFISGFFLLVFAHSLLAPTVSFALTTGPHQPEYMGYEEPGATDMVNLLTGDFSFRIPAIDIPGPEGGFTLPLSYKAGIGLDQEASWVGLGWSLNAGAIARSVVEYPDDADGEIFEITKQNEDIVRGWTSSIPGAGQIGWNTNQGHYGRISLLGVAGVSYQNGNISGGNLMGLDFNSQGISGDLVSVGSALVTVATLGAKAAVEQTFKEASKTVLKEAALNVATEALVTSISGVKAPGFNVGGYWQTSQKNDNRLFHTNFWVYLDQSREEEMYGVLNLGNMDVGILDEDIAPNVYISDYINGETKHGAPVYIRTDRTTHMFGAASDMHYAWSGEPYELTNNPTSLATDNYNVMSPMISGAIEPYRLDVGALAMPRDMGAEHLRIGLVRYKQNLPFDRYKVQFKYNGSNSNTYHHHVGGIPNDTGGYDVDINQPQFGIDDEYPFTLFPTNPDLVYRTTDPVLPDYYDLLFPNVPVEADREGLNFSRLGQANHIEWYSNQELINGVTGFIDNLTTSERENLLPTNNVSNSFIGGFKITRYDGKTYHYSVPIFDWANETYIENVQDQDDITTLRRESAFPVTWLLTAITGSDFVDRNSNKTPDNEDWGHWIKLDYGKFSSDYTWRLPYSGMRRSSDDEFISYSKGKKQQYYLDKIQTRSHTALFIKDVRKDNRGHGANSSSSLRLEEILLINNEDFQSLVDAGFSTNTSPSVDTRLLNTTDSPGNIYDLNDITNPIRTLLDDRQLKKIKFNYDYSLCNGALNSFDVVGGSKQDIGTTGKLTLKSVSFYARNNVKNLPGFTFDYENNVDYDLHKWDGWGFYNSSGTSVGSTHGASSLESDGYAWSLNQIVTPLGATINVEYERDTYASISGINTGPDKVGSDIRVKRISIADGNKIYRNRYVYTQSGNIGPGQSSSGVLAQEPGYIKTAATDYSFYELFDYPNLPVIYGKVSVLSGTLTTDADYVQKQVYEFSTPHRNMVNLSKAPYNFTRIKSYLDGVGAKTFLGIPVSLIFETVHEHLSKGLHTIDITTAKIGQPKSISIFDASDKMVASTNFAYSDQVESNSGLTNQGLFTESTLLVERLKFDQSTADAFTFATSTEHFVHRVFRTTKIYRPSVLTRIETTHPDGSMSLTSNKLWDLITGKTTIVENKSPLGISTLTETVPAYKAYPSMGPLSITFSNSHMLSANTASYIYKTDGLGGNKTGLIAANVQTWKEDWTNYRMLNANGEYEDTNNDHPAWRKSKNYVYEGVPADLQGDGSLSFTDDIDRFDFSDGAANSGWLYTGEILRFDNYSMPVESMDRNDIHTTIKTDATHERKVLEAINAQYTEVAWSGAEEGYIESNGHIYVDGEVRITAASQFSTAAAHTGETSLLLSAPNEKGFHYVMKAGEYDPNRSYRLCAWARSAPANLALYYKLGATETLLTPTMNQAGDWYRLEAMIPASALDGNSTLEVGCRAINGDNVYVDDFRFQPVDAGMNAYVYTKRGEMWYVLDNENMFSEYEYNEKGQLIRTYVESFAYGKVQTLETRQHYKGE